MKIPPAHTGPQDETPPPSSEMDGPENLDLCGTARPAAIDATAEPEPKESRIPPDLVIARSQSAERWPKGDSSGSALSGSLPAPASEPAVRTGTAPVRGQVPDRPDSSEAAQALRYRSQHSFLHSNHLHTRHQPFDSWHASCFISKGTQERARGDRPGGPLQSLAYRNEHHGEHDVPVFHCSCPQPVQPQRDPR